MLNCTEFRKIYDGRQILAFVTDDRVTHIYKFSAKFVTFFMRNYIDDAVAYWRHIHFYEIADIHRDLVEDGKITKFEEKAVYLYLSAKRLDQAGGKCVFKKTLLPPDMRRLEGSRAKVITLAPHA